MTGAFVCIHKGFIMLVLARRMYETVVVGDPAGPSAEMLKVTVLGITHGTVRLGFEVSDDVPINRLEVWQRIRAGIQPGGLGTDPTQIDAQ
jgi:carbon storage regulator CsrA